MSTDEGTTEAAADVDRLFPNLPKSVHGWVRYDQGDSLFEYWRARSTHINGSFEQIVARSRPRDGDIQIEKRTLDQFGHLLGSTLLTRHSPDRSQFLWDRIKKRMGEFPGYGSFEEPPTLPSQINPWDLTQEREFYPNFNDGNAISVTTWECGFGQAELRVIHTRTESGYCSTTRYHDVEYLEPDNDPVTIVSDVIRPAAFATAVNSLEALPGPVTECQDTLEELQTVKGIGPAKAHQLALLGIMSPADLVEHLESESAPVSHYHSEAVETILTSKIRESIGR